MQRASRLVTLITRSKTAVTVAAFIIFPVLAVLKFFVVRSLLSMGVPREVLQAQDAIITGALTAALVWLVLMAVRIRQSQQQAQIRMVADLNHHVRNALEVIFNSKYLRDTDKATAILEGVERIDRALNILLPTTANQRPKIRRHSQT